MAVLPPGDRISLNATVKPTGHIKVAARRLGRGEDIPGRSFEDCDRIAGDSLAFAVTWKSEARIPHGGEPVLLRFQLKQAKLFAVDFH